MKLTKLIRRLDSRSEAGMTEESGLALSVIPVKTGIQNVIGEAHYSILQLTYFIGIISCLIVLFSYSISHSAIVTDGTVGQSGALTGPKYIIPESLGTKYGNNLFQSFSTFNINTGESATFTGSSTIGNIIARVTGGASSSIDGTLSCGISGASLYLINPAGVIFGKNASLDLRGSFYVTTADYIKLSDGGRYDAKTPSNTILTTAAPAAFGFLTSNPTGVTVTGALLQVPSGKTISIAAGDINITNGYLYAPGGQIALASIASTGEALLSRSGILLQSVINADGFSALGKISITQTDSRTVVDSSGSNIGNLDVSNLSGGSGSIYIVGGKFVVNKGWVFADTYGDTGGGGININIAGDMNITNGGYIESGTAGKGNAGNININTKNLSLSNAAQIVTLSMENTGSAGDITIKASENINIDGGSSKIYSGSSYSKGNSGSINIETKNLSLTNAGQIVTESSSGSQGNAGGITIKASENINIDGGNGESGIYSATFSKGNAGSITIDTKDLSLTNAGQINSSAKSNSTGNAGSITIKTSENINIDGYYDSYSSGIFSETYGQGNAGNITIETNNLNLTNFSIIDTSSFLAGGGKAGDITIKASDTINLYTGGIYSETYGKGNAGNINIETKVLSLTNSGFIGTSSASTGNAGSITIKASDSVNIDGYYDYGSEVIYSAIDSGTYGTGSAGSITIETKNLSLTNGTQINTSSSKSTGNAGDITINASDSIKIDGESGIYSQTYGKGNAGNINVGATNLSLTNCGQISTSAMPESSGNAGNITIKASDTINISGYYIISEGVYSSEIVSQTAGQGNAGSINIESKNLSLSDDGKINTSALPGSEGNAGSINIKASDTINVSGYYAGSDGLYASEIVSQTYGKGDAGSIDIQTKNLSITNIAGINTSAREGSTGNGGNITIKTSDSINISGYYAVSGGVYSTGILSETSGKGNGGSINIETKNLNITEDGSISTSAREGSTGSGGNITIRASDTINISGYYYGGNGIIYPSGVSSQTGGSGSAGDVTVLSHNLYLSDYGLVTAQSTGTGSAGNIIVKVDGLLQMNGGDIATSSKYTTGGNIDITANDLRLYDESGITSNVSKGKDKGGNITISSGMLCVLDGSAISADADIGYGGDITINAGTVFLWSLEKALHASSTISGQSGTITINSPLSDISGSMVALTPRYLNADKLLPESCQARRKSNGSFVIRGMGNLPPGSGMFSF